MKLNEGMIAAETCVIYKRNVIGLKNSSANNHYGQQYAFRARKQNNNGQSQHKLTTKRTYHAHCLEISAGKHLRASYNQFGLL